MLVCRPRDVSAFTATRREFVSALETELPQALARLQRGNIAPVNLAQAAIGPGMAVSTRYAKVVDAHRARGAGAHQPDARRGAPARAGRIACGLGSDHGRATGRVGEMVHQLMRALEAACEGAAAKLGTKAEIARERCYRLYTLGERKKRAAEALSYNGLIQSWLAIARLAGQSTAATARAQQSLI